MARSRLSLASCLAVSLCLFSGSTAEAASPCDAATHPSQCGWFDGGTLPPFVHDAIVAKGGTVGAGNVLLLTSGDPNDPDSEISNDVGQTGCGTNPDGWETFDCVLMDQYVPPEDSVVVALSSEWFEWYQTIFTDWMTIAGAGVPTVDVSINSWINNKVDIIPYGPMDTGVVLLTSLAKSKMVNIRVADSGDHIYDTAVVVVPATWFSGLGSTNTDATLLCGDGKLEPGEECDDGNTITDDGCSSLCLGTQPSNAPGPTATCGNLVYAWPNGTTSPYTCGGDLCAGYRCVVGNTISPACYTAEQCAGACAGSCVDVQTAQLDCSTMCTVQPPATSPPPPLPKTCDKLVYAWPDGTTSPYACDDTCVGQRCVTGSVVDPTCFDAGNCDGDSCPGGTCVTTPASDCDAVCALAELPATCTPGVDTTRPAANQKGRCYGNVEICTEQGTWALDTGWEPQDETCNGLDDDCNGVADDMYVTCGDPGLCQNTVNSCDPADPTVPVQCVTLPPPSPVEICNDGLDNDCDGSADDGCECGDDECMPGETYESCPNDCPAPANGTPCDDQNLCTSGDVYVNGVCTPGAEVTCAAENACVVANTCDPQTGCSATKVDCNDDDPCTIDSCDVVSGCVHEPDPACQGVDADGDGYTSVATGGTDCDDGNAAVNPGATELCNSIDDDCDFQVDEGFDAGAACESAPNDCGSATIGTLVCDVGGGSATCDAVTPANPAGYADPCTSDPNACGATASGTVGCDGSCSAATPATPPGYGDSCASDPDACGAIGQGTVQCDGSCDAITPTPVDADGDGTPDCNDQCPNDPNKTSPGLCGCAAAETMSTYYRDADGDGYGNASDSVDACSVPAGYVSDATDCDDQHASAYPGGVELCDGLDNDCDGQVDGGIDADADGVSDCAADACLGTLADSAYDAPVPSSGSLGEKRWELGGSPGAYEWTTTASNKPSTFLPTLAFTKGCSCKQILDALSASTGKSFKNAYLNGCSKNVLKDWNAL